jgi:hypothetical protein
VADNAIRTIAPLLDHPGVTVFDKGMAFGTTPWYCALEAAAGLSAEILKRPQKIGSEQNLHPGARLAGILGLYVDARRGDLVTAQSHIK